MPRNIASAMTDLPEPLGPCMRIILSVRPAWLALRTSRKISRWTNSWPWTLPSPSRNSWSKRRSRGGPSPGSVVPNQSNMSLTNWAADRERT